LRQPSEEISGAIDTFFSIGGEGVDTKSAVTGGFKVRIFSILPYDERV
jgi:hypothetical protein